MSQPSDFSFDDAELVSNVVETAIDPTIPDLARRPTPTEPAAPLVLIQEHSHRGLLVRLTPSAIILMIALSIVSFRRTDPVRYLVPRTSTQVADSPKTNTPEMTGTEGKIIVRAGDARTPSKDGSTAPAPEEVAKPKPGTDDDALTKNDMTEATSYQNEVSPFEFPNEKAIATNIKPLARVIPFDLEPPNPTIDKPASATAKPHSSEGSKDIDPSLLAEVVKPAPKPAVVSNEDILRDIEREAEQKAAEKKFLSALKPQVRAMQLEEELDRSKNSRTSFREDLRKALNMPNELAVAEIERLCLQYGKDPGPDVVNTYKRIDRLAPSRRVPQTDVDLMRISGFPETTILLRLTESLKNTMKTRGGPRDEKELKIKAAKLLLTFPVKSERKTTK